MEKKIKLIEEYQYNLNGELLSKTISRYNFNGKIVEEYTQGENCEECWISYCKYDEKGNKFEFYKVPGFFEWERIEVKQFVDLLFVYFYDNNVHNNEKLVAKWIYKYDSDGKIIEKYKFDLEGFNEVNTLYKYKYDEKGNLVEELYYADYNWSEDYLLTSQTAYYYDERGNRIKEITEETEPESMLQYPDITNYKYDKKNNLIEENREYFEIISDDNDDIDDIINKKISYEINFEKINEKYTYSYEFDEFGNWIKRIKYKNGAPEVLSKRRIEYY